MLLCEVYAFFTIVVTALWTFGGRSWSFRTLSWAMFFPALFAPWFAQDIQFYKHVLGTGRLQDAAVISIIGGLITILQLVVIVFTSDVLKWGKFEDNPTEKVVGIPDLVTGFLRAAGEEIGWRCYLLPCLLKNYSLIPAIFLSGIIWGLYHVPIMLLLTKRLKVKHPYRTVAVQFTSCMLSAFVYSWVAIKSGFSFLAPTIMHFTWNRLNPVATGSIYLNTPGKMRGPQWLINGEGLAGCVVQFFSAILVVYNLRKSTTYTLY